MGIEELYDRMSELLDQASNMCDGVMISDPYDAIDALTDLMEKSGGYDTQIGDLIDDIAQTMEDIDSMESEEYFRGGMDESKKSKKKIIRLSESDLQRIVKKVIKEEIEFNVDDTSFGVDGEEMEDYSSTYSYYDPKRSNYQTTRGTYQDHNEDEYSEEWEDYEFDDYTELKRSDIPNDRWRNLRSRKGFDSMRGDDGKVRIRKNPHHYRRNTKNSRY